MASGGIYRQSFNILFFVPLFFLFVLRVSAVLVFALLTITSIIISAFLGNFSLPDVLLFLRGPIFTFLAYHIVTGWVSSHRTNIWRLWRFLFAIGVIQLPVIFIQRQIWQLMSEHISGGLSSPVDAGFGTFAVKSDFSMSFYVLMLFVILLYSNPGRLSQALRVFLVILFAFTVLAANSQISHIALLFVVIVFISTHLQPKVILGSIVFTGLILVAIQVLNEVGWIPMDLSVTYKELQFQMAGASDRAGNFSRGATLQMFFSEPVSWFGKGPGYYYNVVERRVEGLDIQGHLLTYYAEVGLIGTTLSYALLWTVANPVYVGSSSWRLRVVPLLAFVSILILSSTSYVLNQLPIMVIYVLVVNTMQIYQTSYKQRVVPNIS